MIAKTKVLIYNPSVENTENNIKDKKEIAPKTLSKADLVSFATDIGFSIAIPLAVFVYIGHMLDSRFGSRPLFMLAGLLLSLFSTTIIMYKKIKKML